MRPSRETPGGRAYLDLQNKARRESRPTDELLSLYALEGFLSRLSASEHRERLVLKGGVLLAVFDARRPTRDIDLRAEDLSNDTQTVLNLVREIAASSPSVEDGLVFGTDTATAVSIRDDDEYSGVRVSLVAHLSSARISLHVDVNVGDPVWPAPTTVTMPRVLGGSFEVSGYPMEMVYAEKIVTAVSRGVANTRWRDYGDVYVLTGKHPIEADQLRAAVATVADHRQVELRPLSEVLVGYPDIAQLRWDAWRLKNRRNELPEKFEELLDAVQRFSDPVLRRDDGATTWDPNERVWK